MWQEVSPFRFPDFRFSDELSTSDLLHLSQVCSSWRKEFTCKISSPKWVVCQNCGCAVWTRTVEAPAPVNTKNKIICRCSHGAVLDTATGSFVCKDCVKRGATECTTCHCLTMVLCDSCNSFVCTKCSLSEMFTCDKCYDLVCEGCGCSACNTCTSCYSSDASSCDYCRQ